MLTHPFSSNKFLLHISGLLLIMASWLILPNGLVAEAASAKGDHKVNPHVLMETTLGTIELELFADKAPISTANFLKYVDEGFYKDTIFHRVIKNFMIQGGGMTADMNQKKTNPPIKNEALNGLSNLPGTIAMARTSVIDSATSQFFINVEDNSRSLDNKSTTSVDGYAVFGKVVNGMDVVNKIKAVPLQHFGDHVPETAVVIKSVKRKP